MDDETRNASEERVDDERAAERRLDGNAAAGILSEIFVPDMTVARATCATCGTIRAMGALLVYAHGMGTVMRCPSCDAVVLRVARPRSQLWVDLTGVKLVVMAGVTTAAPADGYPIRSHQRG